MRRNNEGGGTSGQPPGHLYVYCLEGVVSPEVEPGLGETFLGNWVEGASSFLFFSEPAEDRVLRVVEDHSELQYVEDHRFTYEEWLGDRFERFFAGDFEICPAWEVPGPPRKAALRMLLDPGVVFGSGLHPTTRECLEALSWLWRNDPPETVLDLGTGTGVLAVAAGLLGAGRVVAVDLNPLCVHTAARNVKLNGLDSRVETVLGPAEGVLDRSGELVLANIHYEVILDLLRNEGLWKRRWIVFSGLMRTQARALKDRLRGMGMEIAREWDQDMVWHTLAVRGTTNTAVRRCRKERAFCR
ncbi:MAG: 50S ribosomal protein L11 methyltransferase [Deltaproteobacteria bacterium]|nr:50S ribosomal protein L11 methyltransferase [Deltaproteobacteria bacterium]